MLNCLRSAIAGLLILIGVGTLFLWPVTSNRNFELFNNTTERDLYYAWSWKGKLRLGHSTNNGESAKLNQWRFLSIGSDRMHSQYPQHSKDWNSSLFDATWDEDEMSFSLPHLLWAALAAMAALAIKPNPKFRFSRQELLVLIALIAILITIIFAGFYITNRLAKFV